MSHQFGPSCQVRRHPSTYQGSSSSVRPFHLFLSLLSTCHCFVHFLVDLHKIDYLACTTDVTVSLSFGGKLWPISTQDMNLGKVFQDSTQCLGAIFDFNTSFVIPRESGTPSWVVGDTFLVRFLPPLFLKAYSTSEKCLLCVPLESSLDRVCTAIQPRRRIRCRINIGPE